MSKHDKYIVLHPYKFMLLNHRKSIMHLRETAFGYPRAHSPPGVPVLFQNPT